jgi:uncharacterized protein YjiS (DUF1127 family)
MTSKIVTRKNITAAPLAASVHTVAGLMRGIWRLAVAMKHRREFRHIAGLEDRMLADIGLTRGDLRDADSQPLWQDPTSMLARRAAERSASRRRG